jgi:hypothetical protein
VGAAAVLLPGEMTWTARAMSESGPAARCAATTPNAASPSVIKAAKTMTATRMAFSAVFLLSLLKVKAQSGGKSMKTRTQAVERSLLWFLRLISR